MALREKFEKQIAEASKNDAVPLEHLKIEDVDVDAFKAEAAKLSLPDFIPLEAAHLLGVTNVPEHCVGFYRGTAVVAPAPPVVDVPPHDPPPPDSDGSNVSPTP